MRLLVLTHRLPYAPNRGDRLRAFHLLRLLAREHEVHLVSLVHDRHERAQVATVDLGLASVRAAAVPFARTRAEALVTLATTRPLTHVLLNSPAMRRILAETVRKIPPDAVLAYCTGMAQHAFNEPLATLPLVLDMVDLDSEKWAALSTTAKPPLRWIYAREARRLRAFERAAVMRAAATTVASEREQELATRALDVPREIIVAGNGIDLDRFAPDGPSAATQDVLFCGVLNYAPNDEAVQWLMSAVWPRVKQLQPAAVLKVVGMHPSRAVRAQARPGSIEVTGAVPDVRPFFHRAAVATAPLRVARGVQNKVLEAIAAGVPSVVTPAVAAGLPPAAQAAAVTAASADEFADAIVRVLRMSPDQRRLMTHTVDLSALTWERQLEPLLARVRELGSLRRPAI